MGQINTNNYPTVNSLADADLLIVENATNGTGTTTPKQLRENAIGTDTLQTSSQTVTGAINELKGEIDAGAGVVCYDVDTITSGYLGGQFSGSANLLLLHLTTDGTADATNGYMMMLSYSRPVARFAYGRLVDADGVAYKQDVYANNTIICKISNSGTGTESDPEQVVILGIINAGFMLTPTAVVSDRDIIDGQGNTLSVLAEALTKTASGNPVVITDCAGGKARSLITEIAAIQDLHGYDKPWAGGAGKNKFDITEISDVGNTYQAKEFTLKANTTYTISTNLPKNNNNSANLFFYLPSASPDTSVNGVWSGQTRTLTTGADGKFIIGYRTTDYTDTSAAWYLSHEIQIEEGSSATSFAPYSNICPISGRDSVVVDDVGKNQLPLTVASIKVANTGGTWSGNTYTYRGIVYTLLTDSADNITGINVNGNNTGATSSDLWIPVNQTIDGILNGCPSGGSSSTYLQTVWSDQGGHVASDTGSGVSVAGIAITSMSIRVRNGVTISNKVFYPMIRSSSDTDPTFAPYAHSSATIQLGTTVYGADINWDTGVMTITDVIVDLGSLTYGKDTTTRPADGATINAFYATLNGAKKYANTDVANIKCSQYVAASVRDVDYGGWTSIKDGLVGGADVNSRIWVYDSQYASYTVAAFKTAMSGVQLCYKLATPTTIQLTPEQLELLKGYNRVSIESGSIELEYIAKLT